MLNIQNNINIDWESIDWDTPIPIPAERTLNGEPAASTHVLSQGAGFQLGLWKALPGAFATDHTGYIEYIHILQGSGRLVDDAGVTTELTPGVIVLMPTGWIGHWEIDKTLVKMFTISYLDN